MKILYITNGINGSGGLERVLSIKASLLAEKPENEVSILVLNKANDNLFYDFNAKVKFYSIEVSGNPIQYILSYKKGIQTINDEVKPDIISVCDDGLKGLFIPKLIKTGASIIYERHASIELNGNSLKSIILKKIMKAQVSSFHKFVVLTSSNVYEWNSGNNSNILAIPNPLSFRSRDRSTLLNKKVIAVGTHTYNKGYDMLLEIWKTIEAVNSDWILEIYGKDDDLQIYKKLSYHLGLKNVFFFDPVRNIQDKYKEASIMVMSSRSEGFGMVLIEAMECGVPCLSFDCPSGPRDIIRHKQDGILIPAFDNADFAESLIQMISDFDFRLKLGIQAKENVKRFSPDIIVSQWEKLFKELI